MTEPGMRSTGRQGSLTERHCQECGCTQWVPVDVGPIREPGADILFECVCCDALLAPAGYRIFPDQYLNRRNNG